MASRKSNRTRVAAGRKARSTKPKARSTKKRGKSARAKGSSDAGRTNGGGPGATGSKAKKKTVEATNGKGAGGGAKRATKRAQPKGQLPADDIAVGRKLLGDLTSLVERSTDQDAAAILGGGSLEGLLRAVLPQKRRSRDSVYEHLIGHKQRASLMAQVRHAINESFSFPSPEGDGVVSPTRVQWFYDGLTFLHGSEPFHGVVGLFRNGELSWGLGVVDAAPGTSLGPVVSDFVTVDVARRSLRAAEGEPATGIGEMLGLVVHEDEDPDRALEEYTRLLGRHPWVLGAQHVAIEHRPHRDPNLPTVTAERAADGAHDVVLLESPALPVVGKTGKILQGFSSVWHRAQRTMSFVQRQPAILERELGLRFDQPRCFVIAGSGLDASQREAVRRELEAHDAAIRLVTYDDLHRLAERTLAFFEPRV